MKEVIIDKFQGGIYAQESVDLLEGTSFYIENLDYDEASGSLGEGYKISRLYSGNGLPYEGYVPYLKFITFRPLTTNNIEQILISELGFHRKTQSGWYTLYSSADLEILSVNDVLYLPNSIRVSVETNKGTKVFYVGYLGNSFVCIENTYNADLTAFSTLTYSTKSSEVLQFDIGEIEGESGGGSGGGTGGNTEGENTGTSSGDSIETLRSASQKVQIILVGVIGNSRYYLGRVDYYVRQNASSSSGSVVLKGFSIDFSGTSYLSKIELWINYSYETFPQIREDVYLTTDTSYIPHETSRFNKYFSVDLNSISWDRTSSLRFYFDRRTFTVSEFFKDPDSYDFYIRIPIEGSSDQQIGSVRPVDKRAYYRIWKTATYHKGRVFVSDGSDTIYFSEIEDGIEKHDKIPDGNFIKIPLGEQEKILKLISKDDNIYVVRTNGIDVIVTGDSVYESIYRNVLTFGIDDKPSCIVDTPYGIIFKSDLYLYLWNYRDQPFPLNWHILGHRVDFRELFYNPISNELFATVEDDSSVLYKFNFRYFTSIKGRIAYPVFKFRFEGWTIGSLSRVLGKTGFIGYYSPIPFDTAIVYLEKSDETSGKLMTHNVLPSSNTSFLVKNLKLGFSDRVSVGILAIYDNFSVGYFATGSTINILLKNVHTSKFKVFLSISSPKKVKLEYIVYEIEPIRTFRRSKISNYAYSSVPTLGTHGLSISQPVERSYVYSINSTTNTLDTQIPQDYSPEQIKVYLNGILLSQGSNNDYILSIVSGRYRIIFNYDITPEDIVQVDTEV